MQGSTTGRTSTGSVVVHPLDPEDAAITAAFRAMVSPAKGARQGIEARGQFDAFMESVLPRDDVTLETDTLGGVPGLWVKPADWRSGGGIVHLHGGWFNFGSAKAYRHLVGHIAARAGARAFIPDYLLAPEHPFPAASLQPFCSFRAAARLPTFLRATSRPRSSSELSSENTFFICPECFRKAETMRSLPRGVRATIRTRRSSALSTRLTRPFATRRSTRILIEPGVRSTIGPIVLTSKGPLRSRTSSTPKSESPSPVASIPAVAYLVRARIAFIITIQTWSVP